MEKILLHPTKLTQTYADEETRRIMEKTIEFFETKGLAKIKEDDHKRVWYQDFLDFQKREQIFAKLWTPAGYGEPGVRWDTSRILDLAEILAFYGLCYWYTFQVSQLGLGPVFLGRNEEVKHRASRLLTEGAIFAFGLSEKEHGADIYSSDMMLHPQAGGSYRANGDKYYIGNGNKAALVSTFGTMADTGDYVFFVVDSQHPKYECVKNVIDNQSYVAEYALHDYPITDAEITDRGQEAWDTSLNTINICKVNLGWGAIGIDGRPTIDGRLFCDGVAPPAESPLAEAHGVAVDSDTDADPDSDRSAPNAGGTGQAHRRRKRRSGAFWEDQHHATAVETGAHLARCVVYVDLNMVRAGVVDHAVAWNVGGYHETPQERARYRIVDRPALAEALGVALRALAHVHHHWVEAALRDGRTRRERRCTDSVAVGSRGFVEQLQDELGARVRHRALDPHDGGYVLREGAAADGHHSAGETASPSLSDGALPSCCFAHLQRWHTRAPQ